jgi:predicted P-loop ATPase
MSSAPKKKNASQPAGAPSANGPVIDRYAYQLYLLGYQLRLNLVTRQAEVNGIPLDDDIEAVIRRKMINAGYTSKAYFDVVIKAEAFGNRYDPIKDYLSNLPGYDGGNYFSEFMACIQSADHGYTALLFRKFMLGCIAKVCQDSSNPAQNPMLVLVGPQRIGKSRLVRWLCSGVPRDYVEGPLNTDDKDTYDRLCSRWIWEVAELGASLRKADREALKNIITTAEVTIRRAYGRHDLTRPAIANLVGTVNDEGSGLLDDPTGSRRFMICEIESINWQEYTQLNIHKIWSEIYAAYLMGESWELSQEERKMSQEVNERFQIEDPIENHIRKYFKIDKNQTSWFVPSATLLESLQNQGIRYATIKSMQMAVASTCKRMGLVKGKVNEQHGYKGIDFKVIIP